MDTGVELSPAVKYVVCSNPLILLCMFPVRGYSWSCFATVVVVTCLPVSITTRPEQWSGIEGMIVVLLR